MKYTIKSIALQVRCCLLLTVIIAALFPAKALAEYLGYTIPLSNGHSITPMAGAVHSWEFNQDIEPAAGFYFTLKNWNFYLWGHDFLNSHPRFVLGVDFVM